MINVYKVQHGTLVTERHGWLDYNHKACFQPRIGNFRRFRCSSISKSIKYRYNTVSNAQGFRSFHDESFRINSHHHKVQFDTHYGGLNKSKAWLEFNTSSTFRITNIYANQLASYPVGRNLVKGHFTHSTNRWDSDREKGFRLNMSDHDKVMHLLYTYWNNRIRVNCHDLISDSSFRIVANTKSICITSDYVNNKLDSSRATRGWTHNSQFRIQKSRDYFTSIDHDHFSKAKRPHRWIILNTFKLQSIN